MQTAQCTVMCDRGMCYASVSVLSPFMDSSRRICLLTCIEEAGRHMITWAGTRAGTWAGTQAGTWAGTWAGILALVPSMCDLTAPHRAETFIHWFVSHLYLLTHSVPHLDATASIPPPTRTLVSSHPSPCCPPCPLPLRHPTPACSVPPCSSLLLRIPPCCSGLCFRSWPMPWGWVRL